MSHRPTGPACGNNPNHPLTDGDRQAVADFKAYLAERAALRDRIAEALRETDAYAQLESRDDRERFADAVLAVLPPPADRAAVLSEAEAEAERQLATVQRVRHVLETEPVLNRTALEYRGLIVSALMADEAQPTPPETAPPAPATELWRGATELATDREIAARAATGLVGYRQGRGTLLHCLAHKPAPASRWADFHEVTADDLDDGGICVHPRCGRDLLAPWATAEAQQNGAQQNGAQQ
ncbi:hypothetical protein A4E84_20350 [Streptomyces qaidamensis]|uniref:Uncharacterized protein n=1 Tax=Streptomyces qaidamensis TaxID=1783515 RepID=A0A143C2J2_9ACTN|nr:hypothetical protein [Streptomyces qaidamensis]AMW11638.1 hypothetical protein A4E84_20350 [Streptomyces qaidamensis]